MTTTEIVRRRLDAQCISRPDTFTRPEDVVAHLGAVQAQDYLGALWAIGLRVDGSRERDVERALAERRIVRTWPMRGTLHFVAAADARWMTELLAPRAVMAARSRLRALGIDAPVLRRARRTLVKHLESGRRLTRPAAYALLERAKIHTGASRGLQVLWHLAHERLICFGPREGKQPTFVLFDEWVPAAKPVARDDALAELACRYFQGHGPATLADFAWWSGLALSDVRRATHLAGDRIAHETIGSRRYGFVPVARPRRSNALAHVLPAFDEYLVGYRDRSAAIDALPPEGQGSRANTLFSPAIIVEGRVVGTWRRDRERRGLVLTPSPFVALSAPKTRAVERALRRHADFLECGGPVRVQLPPCPTTRPTSRAP